MKKVKRRATAALLIALALVAGLALYTVQLAVHGADWAAFAANDSIYQDGVLNVGTVTDRNGVVLAHAGDGTRSYAEDWLTRVSCLHAVGDYSGFIGSGALSVFSQKLSGYDFVNGTYDPDGDGGTVTLSIDAALNGVAYGALAGRSGAVALCNYKTGELLCMVSSPSYDPTGAPDASADGVYLNRVTGASYTPGSVFKLITLTAALENIDDLSTRSFWCEGGVTIDGDYVKCSGVHGSQTIEQAFSNSCNCAFAQIGLELGSDTLEAYATALGMTGSHSLSGITTAAGSFEKAEAGSSDLAWSGIGQYTDLISPYAMLRLVDAIANGGQVREMTLLKGGRTGTERMLRADTAGEIADFMNYNVINNYGSWNFPGLDLCAKSGTAEVGDGSAHAWFTGFLRDPEHPYAFVVVVEHGGGGMSAAGTVANTVLQAAVAD